MVVTRAKRVTTALEKLPKPSCQIIEIELMLYHIEIKLMLFQSIFKYHVSMH